MHQATDRRTLYHTTPTERVDAILSGSFRDSPYGSPVGVHLCDRADQHFRAAGRSSETVLAVNLPANEVSEDRLDEIQMPDCRDYVIPATVIRAMGDISIERTVPADTG